MARYVGESADYEHPARKVLDFLELALEDGYPFVRDLVHEFLETLVSCDVVGDIRKYYGPLVMRLWAEFFEEIYKKRVYPR